MINTNMKKYDVYSPSTVDEYGQFIRNEKPIRKTTMSIYLNTHEIHNNVKYKDCSYIGLSNDNDLKEGMYINYYGDFLLIKFISHQGRFNQVWMDLDE